ncbi:MAG: hypothetical protein V3T77_01805 [Planctomycetota bacterium]
MLLLLPGCAGLYRHSIATEDFALYGDYDPERLQATGKFLEKVIRAYRREFPEHADSIPPPRVVFDESRLSRQQIFTSEPRQEGYYLPIFRLIRLSPQYIGNGGEDAQTVIFHELAHHFLISAYPKTNSRYWLNEGFACIMEVSFFDANGELVTPFYHPWLHRQALRALGELGPRDFLKEVERISASSWLSYHRSSEKARNYAISWAMFDLLLNSTHGTLEQRLETILGWNHQQTLERMQDLPGHILVSPEHRLHELAGNPDTRYWALDQWLEIPLPRAPMLLPHLLSLMQEGSSPWERARGCQLLTRVLNSQLRGLSPRQRRQYRRLLAERLRSGRPEERQAVANSLTAGGRDARYLRPLIAMLDEEDPDSRAAAARALARLEPKRTIVRPAFWRQAPEAERHREIREWQVWLQRQHR